MIKKNIAYSLALVLSIASAAGATEFGIPQGYPFDDLVVDVDRTRDRGGATEEDPQLYLKQTPAQHPYWTSTSVIASPTYGVCGVGGYSDVVSVDQGELETVLSEVLSEEVLPLQERYGAFLLATESGEQLQYSIQAARNQLSSQGYVSLVSAGDARSDIMFVEARIIQDAGKVEVSYAVLYENMMDCLEEIFQ